MIVNRIKQAEMRIRAASPNWIRQAYRIGRSFRSFRKSADLPPGLVEQCRFCSSRLAMLELLPKSGTVAELGTLRGDFARTIRKLNQPQQLHLIDIDYSQFDSKDLENSVVKLHVGLTHKVVAGFPDETFDWIYIDADHSYDGCSRDAEASSSKVKPGGFLAFNDFAHIDPWLGRYGVHSAVVDFAIRHQWPFAFFCFEPSGLYDVALQRPTASRDGNTG